MKFKLPSFTVLTLFCCLSLIGLSLLPLLNVQLKPSKQKHSLYISYSWRDASAKVVEQEVTSKLEGVFNTVGGVRNINSTSFKGGGKIWLDFKKNSDMNMLRFEAANLIRQIYPNLPEGVSYPNLSGDFQDDEEDAKKAILSYSINAHESPYYIKKYVEEKLMPRLTNLKGVNEVRLNGATSYEWVIEYDTDKLLQLNLSVNDIAESINTYIGYQELGVGDYYVDETSKKEQVSVTLVYNTLDEIEWSHIPIRKIGNRIIYLRDVAQVRFKEAEVRNYNRINGLNSVSIVIYSDKGSNTIELAKQVKGVVEGLKMEVGNDGYSLKLTNDASAFLSEEINKIEARTCYSLLILLLLIILINRSIKYLTVLFLSILVNLSIAVIFYYILDIELHIYAFAGITISFGIIIDNSIIMIDHLRNKKDKKAFLAILAATLTTIGALTIIFFLKEDQRINLIDFGLIMAVNLGVSLLVSLFFVPALMERLKFQSKKSKFSIKRKRRIIKFTKGYYTLSIHLKRKPIRLGLILLLILGFGIPLHLAPDKIKGDSFWVSLYNDTLGKEWFVKEVKPTLKKFIGGSLRLFTEETFANSYNTEPEETMLRVTAKMPPGCSIEQLNEAVVKMENLISKYDEVRLYETNIYNPQNAIIRIYFKDEFEFGSFPYTLKSLLESKAISLGASDWTVSGVGRGFSNTLGTGYKSQRITLEGYNYDRLYGYAEELKKQLVDSSMSRIREIEIQSGGHSTTNLDEYYLSFDPEKVAEVGISQSSIYGFLKNQVYSNNIASIVNHDELQSVKLVSNNYKKFNVWDLSNVPLWIQNKQYKLNQLATIEKRNTGNIISKTNQKYSLNLTYDFIGTYQLAKKVKEDNVKSFEGKLPIGYSVGKSTKNNWDKDGANQYYSLFIVVLIIFFICSILLESLKQPFAIIMMIPISFIGVFLTFYLFDFNFDQGGYASFILLCGISVNSALYIINDYNNLLKQYPERDVKLLYFKAFNYKIIPVLLTIISTVVGLIPFVWNGQNEGFWFSFAVGSIGGLIFSLVGILVYLPVFVLKDYRSKTHKYKVVEIHNGDI
ncbi:efflux RND transporter permease subunit [Aestuariibaculum sp. M13]|uniref:efflux RND transporter permease subunit n=1 Tax=Aestuariibaculum sp. M13 TaxID=2967132 RepID=UPI002159F280|nr:efflux RND transporter permease subunit [Aestuariibaculum sp. M13]MCR8667557.1 efflux RND transporter permease subunit [Aestuariibaculum sp. M13]